MKTKLLLILVILTTTNPKGWCQNCAASDKKDPFTNQRIVETDDIKVYGSGLLDNQQWGFYLSFKAKDKDLFFCVNAKSQYSNGTTKFDRVILKLSDNSIIDLPQFASEGSYTEGVDWRFEKSYSKIEKSDLNKMTSLSITNIRFISKGENFDAEIPSGKAKKITKFVSCILSYQ